MLRSYQYTEKLYSGISLHSAEYQEKEVSIAERFVSANKPENKAGTCPICKSKNHKLFYNKWGVDYLICSECGSIYALCDSESISRYKKLDELNSLRLSEGYQTFTTYNRERIWDEMIDWLKFRCFRFIRRNKKLSIIDVGNRYKGLPEKLRESDICGNYCIIDSILPESTIEVENSSADLIFYNDQIKTEYDPDGKLKKIHNLLKEDGILLLSARTGCGFDILTLKGKNKNIYPYEHISLPSIRGFRILLERNGFDILEITTPGLMDVKYVKDSTGELDEEEMFVKHLLLESNDMILHEFQRFLQKSCMSSFVRILAKKKG